jgi:hypothetical protein
MYIALGPCKSEISFPQSFVLRCAAAGHAEMGNVHGRCERSGNVPALRRNPLRPRRCGRPPARATGCGQSLAESADLLRWNSEAGAARTCCDGRRPSRSIADATAPAVTAKIREQIPARKKRHGLKRFGGAQHYLDSQAQSEQAAALKTTTLCRAVVCSHWLVIDRWGALLGELCSLPVRPIGLVPRLRYEFLPFPVTCPRRVMGLPIEPR